MNEWKLIPGTVGYEASHRGKVRSLPGGHRKGIVLTPGHSSNGYPTVNVYMADGSRQSRPVHDWVLLTFDGPRPPGMQARHLNDDKDDNRWPENLCWGTRPQNAQDALRNQRNHNATKQVCDSGGHLLSGDNLIVITRKDGSTARDCRECQRKRGREWARKNYTPVVKEARTCPQCQGPIPVTRRSDATHCSPVCKRRARYIRERDAVAIH